MPEATLYVMANAYSIDLEAAVKLMPGKNTVYITAINKHFFISFSAVIRYKILHVLICILHPLRAYYKLTM